MAETNYIGFIAAFLISLVLTPIVKRVCLHFDLYAHTNDRTIHHGKIPRLGGIAFYTAFLMVFLYTNDPSRQIQGILWGTTIIFFTGVVDDVINLKPRSKLIMQVIAALVLIYFGVQVDTIRLPFGIHINLGFVSVLFTIVWVVGITNAVNLIDGLDGLAGGMSSIIFVIIAFTALIEGKTEIAIICLTFASAVGGFLIFNFHPATIFMGDCGSMTLGFMISAISLMGFKSSTVMTLALPILILLLPIIDTLSAILRRTLKHKKFSAADKKHLHHQLMHRFGQTATVLIMCGMTALFGFSAFIYLIDKEIGLLIMFIILLIIELFIESTDMIAENYHPILSILHIKQKKKDLEASESKSEKIKE